jgi:transposase-like protein
MCSSHTSGRSRGPPLLQTGHPIEAVTDRALAYLRVLDDLFEATWHRTEPYANNRVEADHGRLKARLGPMRGLKLPPANHMQQSPTVSRSAGPAGLWRGGR